MQLQPFRRVSTSAQRHAQRGCGQPRVQAGEVQLDRLLTVYQKPFAIRLGQGLPPAAVEAATSIPAAVVEDGGFAMGGGVAVSASEV